MINKHALNQVSSIVTALCIALILSSVQAAEAPIQSPYTVNPGDILSISVWKEESLQRQVIIRPDGSFSFPLTGDILAAGQSIEQISQTVTEKLVKYIPDPVVTIAAENLSGNTVYVIGQVNRPGEFLAIGQLDVMQALSMGGGMTAFAQLGDIKILRRRNGKLIAIPFDYKDIEKGKRLHQNIVLEPGDVVVVP
ncbi:MAG: polysaccharide biosynthesis/export family protein [Gammaproteobacteria bacterium]|jgi:polysaccharide export outer membrane protein|nr:sugar transporter [Chromatiales bacterium]MCP4926641.1 polysaccharide export protein [Gammaproteobacteria bacterium]MDP7154314.1 polysaccharide biosynthesis/export family protein [Gammaproteobacteria bacterium]MDP7297289.1 polysaccharide biosynthesis/export family protein [Gammaproteobacteria bacterium]MDP7418749.1 polysaccharide biosynthesis/export family protein [Gammaproteobacteria bacterium]